MSSAFDAACRTFITAQEILVDNSSYPTKAIERNSHDYRPLGLGYANLGALLMSRGMPYDSDAGRDYSATITAVMHGAAYAQSARVARDHGGPFPGYDKNREPMLRVMRKHRAALKDIDRTHVPKELFEAAKEVWDEGVELGEQHGYRNAQATVLAPTGTIGFMMDCDTTGVEPDIALVKYKKLVGGGLMKIVNNTVPMALDEARLHAPAGQGHHRVHRRARDDRGGAAPQGRAPAGVRLRLQAGARRAVDPLHGPHQDDRRGAAVHLRRDLEDRERAEGRDGRGDPAGLHRLVALGAKAVSIYRDGSKRTQPLNTSRDKEKRGGRRRRGSGRRAGASCRTSATRSPTSSTSRGTRATSPSGLFEDGQPGEMFLVMAKEGSTISGFADAFAQAISYALQYGVPLQDLVDKFSHVRFEPSGMTKNPDIRFAKSIVDYIFRWMAAKFLSPEAQYRVGVNNREEIVTTPEQLPLRRGRSRRRVANGRDQLAGRRRRSRRFRTRRTRHRARPAARSWCAAGACYKCSNCGTTSGCALAFGLRGSWSGSGSGVRLKPDATDRVPRL